MQAEIQRIANDPLELAKIAKDPNAQSADGDDAPKDTSSGSGPGMT